MRVSHEDQNMPLPSEPAFAVHPNELIVHTSQRYDGTPLCELVSTSMMWLPPSLRKSVVPSI